MRTLSADWMANTNKAEPELHSMYPESGEAKTNTFYPRPVAPTAAQVLIILIFFYSIFNCLLMW